MPFPKPTAEALETYRTRGWLVVEDAIAYAHLDELGRHCERIIDEKETLAYDWAWEQLRPDVPSK